MEVLLHTKNGIRYVECPEGKCLVSNAGDAVDLVGSCGEHQSTRILLYDTNLDPDFFDLKTGVAGDILQKFINYSLKVAAVVPEARIKQGKFREMVLETNRSSREFHVFTNKKEAEAWLIQA